MQNKFCGSSDMRHVRFWQFRCGFWLGNALINESLAMCLIIFFQLGKHCLCQYILQGILRSAIKIWNFRARVYFLKYRLLKFLKEGFHKNRSTQSILKRRNQQIRKNYETCALHVTIPAKLLITVRTA